MAFNKMFIMLPLMFAVRKLDGEDPDIIFMLRCSYAIIQGLIILAVLYINMAAAKISKSKLKDKEIFVPPPPQPFADPNAKVQYTKTTLGAHVLSAAKKLGFSTLSGVGMTVGLHWYKGMIIGLAMQTIMGPLNLMESAFAKYILLGGVMDDNDDDKGEGKKAPRLFGEKHRNEMTDKDEIIDTEGKLITLKKEKAAGKKTKAKPFADILLDTWDDGAKADIGPLMKAMKKDNVNFKTKESSWSPLMIMTAIKAEGSIDAMKKLKTLGASASMTDKDGWNALHWAAFHGSVDGATTLMDEFDGMKLGLHLVKDLEGLTPLDHAVKENNIDVATYLKNKLEVAINTDKVAGIAEQEGIRKRK